MDEKEIRQLRVILQSCNTLEGLTDKLLIEASTVFSDRKFLKGMATSARELAELLDERIDTLDLKKP